MGSPSQSHSHVFFSVNVLVMEHLAAPTPGPVVLLLHRSIALQRPASQANDEARRERRTRAQPAPSPAPNKQSRTDGFCLLLARGQVSAEAVPINLAKAD